MPANEKVEILTKGYLDFYHQHPPAWVNEDSKNDFVSKLEKWLLLEKDGKRAYHDHNGNMRPHPVAVKNHEEWFNQNFGGQENVPKEKPEKVEAVEAEKLDPEVEKLKQLETQDVRAGLDQIHRLLIGQQKQFDNSAHRLQQLHAARSVALIKDPTGEERKKLNEAISKEIVFYDRQKEIVLSLVHEQILYENELKLREKTEKKKAVKAPKAKFEYDSPEESAIGISPLKSLSEQGGGVNSSYIITLENGKKAIFKPAKGESNTGRNDIPKGTYFKREVAAYKLAKIIGLERYVPVTVIRKEDEYGIGSAQEFVDEELMSPYNGPIDLLSHNELLDGAFFDAVIGNEDRHYKNFLVKAKSKTPVFIDHGLAFPNANKPSWPRSIFIKALQAKGIGPIRIDERHIEQLQKLIADESAIRKKLAPLLEPEAIDGIFWRIKKMDEINDYSIGFAWGN